MTGREKRPAPDRPEAKLKVRLTRFQRSEVHYGLEVSEMTDDLGSFGWIEQQSSGWYLMVTDVAGALYRVTSSRDIFDDDGKRMKARSMNALARQIVEAAGGESGLDAAARKQLKRWGLWDARR